MKRSADFLHRLLAGSRVVGFMIHGGRYKSSLPEGLADFMNVLTKRPIVIEEVSCKGKFMYWCLRPGWTMWCTYGMSGQWSTTRDDKHCSIELCHRTNRSGILGGEGYLFFNDPRHFGTIKFVHDHTGEKTQAKLDSLGPDMLSSPPTPEQFKDRLLVKPNRTVAETVMDQRCVSGVGNYVKAESLYLAELSPHRIISSLSYDEIEQLRVQITNVMQASYNTGGATISTYRNVDGTKGGAQTRFAVYGNKVDPMGNPVTKEETKDGRTTWWVPSIQK